MKRIIFFAMTIALLLSACENKTTPSGGVPRAWVDQPLDGSVFPIGAVVHITTHASDAQGISNVAIYVGADILDTGAIPEGQTYVLLNQDWVAAKAGVYLVSTRAQSVNGTWSSDAVTTITILDTPPLTSTPRFTVTPPFTPTSRFTVTPSPTLAGPLTFTLTQNAFCRQGPDVSFPDVTGITAGETVDLLNVSADGFWYYVYWKQFNAKCWVGARMGNVNGDISGIGVLAGPAQPSIPSRLPHEPPVEIPPTVAPRVPPTAVPTLAR
jgi:hypothetical protein